MSEILDFNKYPLNVVLKKLLKDKTTKKNIIWATSTFEHLGREFDDKKEISETVFKMGLNLKPRILKSEEEKLNRTRNKAEVFTPVWVVNEMNNYTDNIFFNRSNVFNIENEKSWKIVDEKVKFPKENMWKKYITRTFLEITCGEGPYLVSRYDVSNGELIENTLHRVGILDRKLRIVNENTTSENEWVIWATKAIESVYGYEYQGDNLLIARANILLTFVDYYEYRWKKKPDKKLLNKIANIITWNIWQMDGLSDTVPFAAPYESERQINIFDIIDNKVEKQEVEQELLNSKIRDWRKRESRCFRNYKEVNMKKFDFVIGNPPYQEESKDTSDKPIYNYLMDEAYMISDKALLITPARFLFNAGNTSKVWNKKMLNDEHLKIVKYVQKSSKVFPQTDIKGGVVITYRDASKNFGSIEVFITYEELRSIFYKVKIRNEKSFSELIYAPESYKLSKKLHEVYPQAEELLSKGHKYDITTNIFDKLPFIFIENGNFEDGYIQMIGRQKNKRVKKWVNKDFIENHGNLHAYKVILPKSNGSGALGEELSTPLIGEPLIGHTQTFISIGNFDTPNEAKACLKYVRSKFARTMLGILKITQHNPKATWKYVPLQDFTENSDIDWSKSISEIDEQLYKKYDLSKDEINFIETNVKEMK
ncbi:Eco57I restriction-modification methylase domain-containing protein [Lagierella sp.]|uniref:Eco57I restriction-modification methylase domain-containing protein n=1 Tax=Lagierella sp. TaxID=2849657 RepID=UPI0026200F30|nr:Eco57I restriction-modification methylase domain-containing protein [Lagierella sp.]